MMAHFTITSPFKNSPAFILLFLLLAVHFAFAILSVAFKFQRSFDTKSSTLEDFCPLSVSKIVSVCSESPYPPSSPEFVISNPLLCLRTRLPRP